MVKGRVALKPAPLKRIVPTLLRPVVANGLGWYSAAFAYLKNYTNFILRNPVGILRESMKAQVAASPNAVSGPFTILRVDGNGAQWIDLGMCKQ
jgi:hypothetical protein